MVFARGVRTSSNRGGLGLGRIRVGLRRGSFQGRGRHGAPAQREYVAPYKTKKNCLNSSRILRTPIGNHRFHPESPPNHSNTCGNENIKRGRRMWRKPRESMYYTLCWNQWVANSAPDTLEFFGLHISPLHLRQEPHHHLAGTEKQIIPSQRKKNSFTRKRPLANTTRHNM